MAAASAPTATTVRAPMRPTSTPAAQPPTTIASAPGRRTRPVCVYVRPRAGAGHRGKRCDLRYDDACAEQREAHCKGDEVSAPSRPPSQQMHVDEWLCPRALVCDEGDQHEHRGHDEDHNLRGTPAPRVGLRDLEHAALCIAWILREDAVGLVGVLQGRLAIAVPRPARVGAEKSSCRSTPESSSDSALQPDMPESARATTSAARV
jgi:hypothetical protein